MAMSPKFDMRGVLRDPAPDDKTLSLETVQGSGLLNSELFFEMQARILIAIRRDQDLFKEPRFMEAYQWCNDHLLYAERARNILNQCKNDEIFAARRYFFLALFKFIRDKNWIKFEK